MTDAALDPLIQVAAALRIVMRWTALVPSDCDR
jgi:hypothetical protein